MEKTQIFIGAFGGTGSRLVAEIFEKLGLYVGRGFSNPMHDFGGHGNQEFVSIFNKCFINNDYSPLFKYITKNLQNPNRFAIKHGHFMYIYPQLRSAFPNSKMVYVMRNPIDSALNPQYTPYFNYGKLKKNNLKDKIQFYINESTKAINHSDLVIRYEDLVYDLDSEIIKIAEFCNLDPFPSSLVDIYPSKNLGQGHWLYNKFDLSELGY